MSDSRRPASSPSHASPALTRRAFLGTAGAAAALTVIGRPVVPVWAEPTTGPAAPSAPESVVKLLYASLTDAQKKAVCFDWDFKDPEKGLLRTRVENNWHITKPNILSAFYTKDQQAMIRSIFEGMLQPDWIPRIDRQLKDDAGGYGVHQSIAIFGKPAGESGAKEKFEFVLTGRHMTLRCDGHSAEHVAFGGPILHGHAATGLREKPDHAGNIFWPQALEANKLYQMLDGKHRELALVTKGMPTEEHVEFHGKAPPVPGIPVTELAADQKEQLQKVLGMLIEPYRQTSRDDCVSCLKTQGGLDACRLAFYAEADMGNDGVWDNWRLEGPSFVWHFRGKPHVHIWVNVADDPGVELNAYQDSIM